ncbi:hypothetical protein GALL_144350 [mine drainage metagenome]|uniref:Uncharacterized protein n=1 Tax=mine drainage metagenome TaxID=410659 RepID=A0A1J5SHR7_9ZZZZ
MAGNQGPFDESKVDKALKLSSETEEILRGRLKIDAQSAATKSFIAFVVSLIYAGSVASVVLVCLWGVWTEKATILEGYEKLTDFIKVAVLPIVTLVIGYYSGRNGSDGKRKKQ